MKLNSFLDLKKKKKKKKYVWLLQILYWIVPYVRFKVTTDWIKKIDSDALRCEGEG